MVSWYGTWCWKCRHLDQGSLTQHMNGCPIAQEYIGDMINEEE